MSSKKLPERWLVSVPIVVTDKAVSRRWYTEKLGLSLVEDEDHWVTVGGKDHGSRIHLCQASENQPLPIPLEPGRTGYVIAIPGDFEAECQRMRAAGVQFVHLPQKAPWGWFASVVDPDGNELHLAPPPA